MPMKKTQNHAIKSIVFSTANQRNLHVAFLQTLIAAWSFFFSSGEHLQGCQVLLPSNVPLFSLGLGSWS
jgi:hypothetical protein